MIIKNNIVPIKGFSAMAIWPFIFVRKDWLEKSSEDRYKEVINHEKIHFRQQKELLVIGFYLVYIINWAIEGLKMLFGGDKKAYKDIIFEREARCNQSNFDYLNNRKMFAFIKYIWDGTK